MHAHGQTGCVLTIEEVVEGVELKGTELEGSDLRMIKVRFAIQAWISHLLPIETRCTWGDAVRDRVYLLLIRLLFVLWIPEFCCSLRLIEPRELSSTWTRKGKQCTTYHSRPIHTWTVTCLPHPTLDF